VIAAVAPMLDLPLDAVDVAAVAMHLRIAQGMAAAVAAVDLPDEAEPLPVFRP
jgi:hypothetical protein